MCRYEVPCWFCGIPVLVDQPDNSKIPIEIAYCERCTELLKNNDTRIVGVMNERRKNLKAQGFSDAEIRVLIPNVKYARFKRRE